MAALGAKLQSDSAFDASLDAAPAAEAAAAARPGSVCSQEPPTAAAVCTPALAPPPGAAKRGPPAITPVEVAKRPRGEGGGRAEVGPVPDGQSWGTPLLGGRLRRAHALFAGAECAGAADDRGSELLLDCYLGPAGGGREEEGAPQASSTAGDDASPSPLEAEPSLTFAPMELDEAAGIDVWLTAAQSRAAEYWAQGY
jgi:hypothetical protein